MIIGNVIGFLSGNRRTVTSSPPSGLKAIPIAGGVRLSWTDAAVNTICFEVWRKVDSADYSLIYVTLSKSTVTYDDLTNHGESTVLYKVRATGSCEGSAFTTADDIVIAPEITSLAATWVDDFARVTFNGCDNHQTEIETSKDGGSTWTLEATVNAGINTVDIYTWQGTAVYFRARTKLGTSYGEYCIAIHIHTPLVFKVDCDPLPLNGVVSISDNFGLTDEDAVITINWGDGNITTRTKADEVVNTPANVYAAAGQYFVQISGDLDHITKFYDVNANHYGDLSKWVLPQSITLIRVHLASFSGDLSDWEVPDNAGSEYYLSETPDTGLFTGIPRGHLNKVKWVMSGIYLQDSLLTTTVLDEWLAYFDNHLDTHTPTMNSGFVLNGARNGVPTGGNANTHRVSILGKYVAAGYTCTITVRNS